ncbi:MAG: hypothetical protein HY898_32925 [Deltaproteobacteria bacterium]|nr:hypothetical protein [Deltaproteobacteria bacterium]
MYRGAVVWAASVAVGVTLAPLGAHAQLPPDDRPRILDAEGMAAYEQGAYDDAATKLWRAESACEDRVCAPSILARILLHRAIVSVARKHRSAILLFKAARNTDPTVLPEPKYLENPDVQSAFEEVLLSERCAAARTAECVPGFDGHPVPVKQEVNHRIPVYIEFPSEFGVVKAVVYVRPNRDELYHAVPLHPAGHGYGALIPCDYVEVTGDVASYIRGYDGDGKAVAGVGSESVPLITKIVDDLDVPVTDFKGRSLRCPSCAWFPTPDSHNELTPAPPPILPRVRSRGCAACSAAIAADDVPTGLLWLSASFTACALAWRRRRRRRDPTAAPG